MDVRARNRCLRAIESLDGMARQVSWYLCRLTTQLSETQVDANGVICERVIKSSTDMLSDIFSVRAQILRKFFENFPNMPMEETEKFHDPTSAGIFLARTYP